MHMEHLPVPRLPPDDEQGAIEPTVIRATAVSAASYRGYPEAMSEEPPDELGQLLRYWRVLTHRKLTLLVVGIGGALAALAFSVLQTPQYGTVVTLEIQQTAVQQQPFQDISSAQDPNLLQTQTRLLTSRTLQSRVYSKLSGRVPTRPVSDSSSLTAVRGWLGLTTHKSAAWTEALERAAASLEATAVKDSRIVQIVCVSTLPQAAADYANTLAEEFIQENLEQRWSLYQSTGVWLERAQQELKGKLEGAERQLLDYATASKLVVVGKENNIGEQRLLQLQIEASKAQAERIAKESSYRTALSQSGSQGEVLDSGAMGRYETKLADLRRELAEVSTSLTPAHPKVKRLEAQIEEVESSRVRERY